LIENWYKFFFGVSKKNVTSENTELKQAMLKLNTTFMLQRRCRLLCCNIWYDYIIEPKYRWNCKQGILFTAQRIHRYHAVKR